MKESQSAILVLVIAYVPCGFRVNTYLIKGFKSVHILSCCNKIKLTLNVDNVVPFLSVISSNIP